MKHSSFYKLLKLPQTASPDEIEEAYHRLLDNRIRVYDEKGQEALHQAYGILGDPASRAAYDAMLSEYIERPGPRPLHRVYGLLSGLVGAMRSRISINFVPLNWMIVAFCALGVGLFLWYLRPPYSRADLQGLVLVIGIAVLMSAPSLWDYTAFAVAPPTTAPLPDALLPLPGRATGRFRNAKEKRHFHVRANCVLCATDSPTAPYVILARFSLLGGPEGEPHEIPLTRGLTVDWGYEFAWGIAKPSIRIRGDEMSTLLTLDDPVFAAGLAARLKQDLS